MIHNIMERPTKDIQKTADRLISNAIVDEFYEKLRAAGFLVDVCLIRKDDEVSIITNHGMDNKQAFRAMHSVVHAIKLRWPDALRSDNGQI